MASTVVLEIPARKEYVAVVRQVVSIIAGRGGALESSRIDDLKLAASEACMNAIEAYQQSGRSEEARVVVRLVEEPRSLVVSVVDTGPGFDPVTLATSRLEGGESASQREEHSFGNERGRGITLIRALVDEATFESSAEGTSVTMTVALPNGPG